MFHNYHVINSNNNNNNNNGNSDCLLDSKFGKLLNGKNGYNPNWANAHRLNFPSYSKNDNFQTAKVVSGSTNRGNPVWKSVYTDSFEGGDYGKIGRLPRTHQRHSPVTVSRKHSDTPAVHERSAKTTRHPRKHRGGHHHDDKEASQQLLQQRYKAKSPEPTNKLFSTEQHYQHYYSYYFNRKPEPPQPERQNLTPKDQKRSKVQNIFYYGHYKPVTQIMNEHMQKSNRSDELVCKEDERFHVLREKLANNNMLLEDGQWLADEDVIKVTGGLFNIGHMDAYDSKLVANNSEAVKQAVDKKNSLEREFGNSVRPLQWNKSTSKNNKNWNSQDQLSDDEYGILKELKCPPPNNREKVGIKPKKHSPPMGPRVLLYNCNSPNMSRTSLTRPVDPKRNFLKSPKAKNSVGRYSEIDKVAERYEHFARAMSPQRPPQKSADNKPKIAVEQPINHIRLNDNDNNNDAYSDDGDDDDLDNVSNNDGSCASDSSSDSENGYRAFVYKMTHPLDRTVTPQSITSSEVSQESLANPPRLLVASLFPNVPPYLSFSSNTRKGPEVTPELHRVLKWRVTNVMPKVVRLILANSGMRLLKKTNDFMGVWGKHMKSPCFKTIRPYQKINHLPGSFKIGRKDSCWKNLQRQMNKHGKKDFGFMPKTFIIPNDLKALRRSWPKYAERNVKWIIKPPASARGTGIRVVNRWAQIPKRKPLIVQKYIERPLLINGSKFDLRLYVLVTSVNPLRVFMYHNGLARFASVKYSDKTDTLHDRCMHLTNYSINKFSTNYSKNEDVNACHGHKWTIKSLWTYLGNRGIHTDYLWEALRSLVLRTILAGESPINSMVKMNVQSKYSCFELFGFDVLLDAELIPWLLEVNISPSLHSELPLDSHVKAPLVQGVLNTALFNVPPKLSLEKQMEIASEMMLPPGPICFDKRMYVNYLSRAEKIKHNSFTRKTMEDRDQYVNAILTHLTPDDVRCLIVAEDELARCAPLERIFPTNQTYKYLKYTDNPRYYNRLLDAWENRYGEYREEGIALLREYCKENYHLEVPPSPAQKDSNGNDAVSDRPCGQQGDNEDIYQKPKTFTVFCETSI